MNAILYRNNCDGGRCNDLHKPFKRHRWFSNDLISHKSSADVSVRIHHRSAERMFEYFIILSQFKHKYTHIHRQARCTLSAMQNASTLKFPSYAVFDLSRIVSIDTRASRDVTFVGTIDFSCNTWMVLFMRVNVVFSLRTSYLQFNIYISMYGTYACTGSSPCSLEYGIFFISNVAFSCISAKIGQPKSAILRQEWSKCNETERSEDDMTLYRFTNKNRRY